jgi:primosomal protein N' (replication factor Y)
LPVEETFSYRLPDLPEFDASAGARVLVPFGSRQLTGVIVEMDESDPPVDDLKDVIEVLDEVPSVTLEILDLTRWMADYYVCSWGEALRATLPSGTDVTTQQFVVRRGEPPETMQPEEKKLFREIDDVDGTAVKTLKRRWPALTAARINRLRRLGLVDVVSRLKLPRVSTRMEPVFSLSASHRALSTEELARMVRGPRQRAVLSFLAGRAGIIASMAEIAAETGASSSTVASLVEHGLIERAHRELSRRTAGENDPGAAPVRMHPTQEAAFQEIRGAVAAGDFAAFLLHGVTGSGKTEVYIAALKEVVAAGKTGIILVPEISLTPQTVARFQAHFGDAVAVLHSRIGAGERFDTWRRVRAGQCTVVVGPRSAVLAPLSDVGLIVVDEEHEGSYKQYDPAPRYHARDVAVMRAFRAGAVCVLGSATPSLESYANAKRGKYTLLEIPERAPTRAEGAALMPEVAIVDLIAERKKKHIDGSLSRSLRRAIADRLEKKEQVILLQNRRGFAPVLECDDCGHAPECPDCAVTFTFHARGARLRCHYCGKTARRPLVCPSCGSRHLTLLGSGTQRVEDDLARLFPSARVLRMDLDTTYRKGAHYEILAAFAAGEADILLGTQMVAKGLDFGRVSLVGVVNADTELLMPDFRSEERTFHLLTQVAGRAGRADIPGKVILQTRNPGSEAIRFATRHDYAGFAAHALRERELLRYPPFGQITVVTFSGTRREKVVEYAEAWTACLEQSGPGLTVLGPGPAFIERVRRRYRYQSVVKAHGARSGAVQDAIRDARLRAGSPPGDCRVSVDVDAVSVV